MESRPKAISDLIVRIVRRMESGAFSSGLNPAQWHALRYLANTAPNGRSVAEFARYHHSTTGTASQTIDALVTKGLARRVPVLTDARKNRIDLTAAGTRLLRDDPIEDIAGRFSQLDSSTQQTLYDALKRVLAQ